MVEHPIKNKNCLEEAVSDREIKYTRHFKEQRLPRRENVSEKLIKLYLNDMSDLVDFAYSEDEHRRFKYELLFNKSTKYFLKVVLSMNRSEIYIVTAHVINKTKREKSKMIG